MNRKTKLLASLLPPLLGLLAAAPAAAGTELGRAYAPYAYAECGGALVLQTGIAIGSPSYKVPPGGGVITSWGTITAGAAGTAKFKVMRPTGVAGQYLAVGEDGPHPVAANSSASFAGVRIPVQAGDVIGLIGKGTNCMAWFPGSSFATAVFGLGVDPAPGTAASVVGHGSEFALSVTATVEPDADQDGYGDESQDQCPADPSAHAAPCPVPGGAPAAPAAPTAGADSTPPHLELRGRRLQRVLRRGAVIEVARTDEAASLHATASLAIAGPGRLPLRAVSAAGSAGVGSKLTLRVTRAAKRRLRAALRRGRRVRALVHVTATDAAGNTSRASQPIVIRR